MRAVPPAGVAAVAAEIDRRLGTATPAGRITAARLLDLVADHLRLHDDEVARDLALAGRPHWNLWMWDSGPGPAVFAVFVFRPDGLDFFHGLGESYPVRRFCEHEAPADPALVFAALRDRFDVPDEPLRLDRPTAESWLGRPRPW